MDVSSIHIYPPHFGAIAIFCLVWPVVAFFLLRRNTASPAPWMAMFVPLGVSAIGMWLALRSLAAIGSPSRVVLAAGRADAMVILAIGPVSAILVGVAAWIRRHRPTAGIGTIALAAVLLLTFFGATVGDPLTIVQGSLILAHAVVFAALALLVLNFRGRATGKPLPFASIVIAAALLLTAAGMYHCFHVLRGIAMHG